MLAKMNDDQLLQLRNFIARKYGVEAVLEASNFDRKEFFRRYKKFLQEDKEIVEKFNIVVDNNDFEVSIEEGVVIEREDKKCISCGKEWAVMSSKDQYYIFKHQKCENCFLRKL